MLKDFRLSSEPRTVEEVGGAREGWGFVGGARGGFTVGWG